MQISFLNRLTLRQITVFLAVCQHRSYSRAAEHLALTQPAVSAQIRSLEELVGQALFDYIGRQLFLTSAGELMLRAARELQQRLVHLEIELTDLHGQLQGRLNIAVETSAERLMGQKLQHFCQHHPGVDMAVHVGNHDDLLSRLRDNLDDLAVMTKVPSDQSLQYTPFAEHTLEVVIDRNHPLCTQTGLRLQDLLSYPMLLREPGSGTRQITDEYCRQNSVVIPRYQQLGSNRLICHALPGSENWSILPTDIIRDSGLAQQLSTLNVHGFPIRRSWCSVYPRAKHLNPLSKAFLDTLHTPIRGAPRDTG
ncbi:LysR family transcriptional regulator [Spongiibacter sp. KMU-166]|uniref:LysR family transcriptional regulator n=1 Tax=Spongiibacter thalassae TaxID=2721624 RepID=A0ABX1GF36_9GAMM|nr:LysR family transcriptional regulator [Spongiibacter thalassae]NKI17807.1 LysR family transcriptional regulator [Spongiibacter thalassae]